MSYPLNPLFPGLKYESSSALSADGSISVFLKSSREAFQFKDFMLTKISDADYPGWSVVAPTSMTRVGTTVTVTLPAATNWQSGSTVIVSGANQAEYNGERVITVTDSTHIAFQVTGTPATPATGTISIKGGRTTVPGIVYLDGYFFVMDENAVIYNCDLNNAANWNALNFLSANIEPGSGVAITKSQNYVIAMKSWSTEFFYDAGNSPGSPLSPVLSAFSLVGCASGDSVASINGIVAWVSKTKQKGRAIHVMDGAQQKQVSTPDIERILNNDPMDNVYSYGLKISGHTFYVLGLRSSGLTLVYDMTSDSWNEWSSLEPKTALNCYISATGGVATVSFVNHGNADGDPVLVSASPQPSLNGIKQIRYIDADTFQFDDPGEYAFVLCSVNGYSETYFKYTKYVHCAGRDLLLHETSGDICEIIESVYQDDGMPINYVAKTGKVDGNTTDIKVNHKIKVVGNKNGGMAMIRWSDDDYFTNSPFRPVDLSSEQAQLRRCGSFRRRSFELRHISNSPVQVSSLELEIQ